MKVPDKFPPGSKFVPTFGGDWFAMIPGEGWFKFSDDGSGARTSAAHEEGPAGGICERSEPPDFASEKAAS